MSKRANKAEARYMERVASIGCVLCKALGEPQQSRTAVHHIRFGQGKSQRSSHYLTVALCHDCHQGPLGVHGDRTLLRIAKLEELDLLALTIEELSK